MAEQCFLEDTRKEETIQHVSTNVSVVSMNTEGKERDSTVFEDIVQENKILQKEVEREERGMKANFLLNSEKEDHERKKKQIMYLLTRTQFYAKYLAERIQPEKEMEIEGVQHCSSLDVTHPKPIITKDSTVKENNRKRKVDDDAFDQSIMDAYMETMKNSKLQTSFDMKNAGCSSLPSIQLSLFEGPCLKDYQIKGVEWLKILYENAINGILADEMGLGKTVQVIALICHLISKKLCGPYLIIAPLSTILSWLDEFEKFAPKLPTILFHGTASKRVEIVNNFRKESLSDGINMYPIVITTYEIPLREKQFFLTHQWEYIIVDEGQRLKNYRCHLSKFLKEIASKNRLLLTGTPLQNNLGELWALLNFLIPEIFNDLAVFERWLSADELNESQIIVEREVQNKIVSTMHQILSPFILRRMKSDVELNLPPKKEVLIYAPMSHLQWEMYTATMNGNINSYLKGETEYKGAQSKKRRCSQNINYTELSDSDDNFEDKIHISRDISNTPEQKFLRDKEGNLCKVYLKMQNPAFQLRKISNHPYLVQMPVDLNHKGILVDENIVQKSGKMLVLDILLPRLKADNHKVLLFSTMTMLLDVIEEYVIMRKYNYVRLDGDIGLRIRNASVKEFTTNPDVFLFLMSTRAGGLGLNLSSADTVILFDSDWNPQVDLQAQDRCHRIGQTKPVVVFRLVTQGTIDEKIVNHAARKIKLGKLILHKGLNKMKDITTMERTISLHDLKTLLDSKDFSKIVHTSGTVLTENELDEILDRRECAFAEQCSS